MPTHSTAAPLRLGLSPDSELVTRGLIAMLTPYAEQVRLVRRGEAAHVTLLDPTLCEVDPWLRRHRHGRVAFYTWDVTPALVDYAAARGILGCLTKHLPADRLVHAVQQIHQGHLVVEAQDPVRQAPLVIHAAPSPLTPREQSVIRLVTNGLSNEDIAHYLTLSINSVKSYIRSAYRKIDAGSRAQAVVWGVRNGYLCEASDADLGRAG